MQDKPSFLLVHGSWHGPWCWTYLQQALRERGYDSSCVSLPSLGTDLSTLGGFADDARAVSDAAAGLASDHVVVVGHSYGGAVISEARFGDKVRRLVFLAAFMPDSGRGYTSYLPPGPLPPYVGLRDDGLMSVPAGQALESFYHDCPPELARWAESQLRPQSQQVLSGTIGTASWRKIPSTYIVATDDRALPTDFQRQFVAQADQSLSIAASHSPMLSKPGELADLLIGIARA